jgi:hypothetical protein
MNPIIFIIISLSPFIIYLLFKKKYFLLFSIIIFGISFFLLSNKIKHNIPLPILYKDIKLSLLSITDNSIKKLLDNNKLSTPIHKQNKILLLSIDDRPHLDYIKIHNDNLAKYAKKYNYDYIFLTKTMYDVYWSKLYLVLKYLQSNKYDYVMFFDSDTIIINDHIQINDIINSYNSDILISDDNFQKIGNAGLFIIKNSDIGKQFLIDCINSLDTRCLDDKKNKLHGMWGMTCYEQGQMNLQIKNKYHKYTTLLDKNLLLNTDACKTSNFALHLYDSSSIKRKKCFNNLLK